MRVPIQIKRPRSTPTRPSRETQRPVATHTAHEDKRTVIFQYNWKMRLVVGIPLHESPFSLQLLMMFLRRRPISLIYFLPDLQIHLQFSNESDCLAR
jgi:hypothetical protein